MQGQQYQHHYAQRARALQRVLRDGYVINAGRKYVLSADALLLVAV